MQDAKEKFAEKGLLLAAISYDSPGILKDFASRHHIEFPLLADPDSKVIRSFEVLNREATGMTKGMAHPGFFYVDETGVIREKYFEAQYTNRFTANNVIGKLSTELTTEVSRNVEAPHLQLTLSQSDRVVVSGSRVTLTMQVDLPPGVHVYSPGVKGYKPIELILHPTSVLGFSPAIYPPSKTLYLKAIREQVPVFEGRFRITKDVTVNPSSEAREALDTFFSSKKKISINGDLKYQACDTTLCYPPTSVPVQWQLEVEPLDLKRSPGAIRHK